MVENCRITRHHHTIGLGSLQQVNMMICRINFFNYDTIPSNRLAACRTAASKSGSA